MPRDPASASVDLRPHLDTVLLRRRRDVRLPTTAIRLATVALAAASAYYMPWLIGSLNWQAPWLSVPFAFANLLVVLTTLLAGVNNWVRSVPAHREIELAAEPWVAVVIPTCGEPLGMVERTLRSVLEQDWPHERLVVLLSDDAARPETRNLIVSLAADHPLATLRHLYPPAQCNPARRGQAKAGNLNAALDWLDAQVALGALPECPVVETRDADDEVGDPRFLRLATAQLLADDTHAYVQTVKDAAVGAGDPFGNREPMFYRGAMLGRHANNTVFPCGSGLLWRRTALDDIGGFPTWNLVEDLQSGVEALRRGWRGVYLPILGARAQHAPEDLPNVYKQRGTWALDTVRLALWGNHRGLSLRQRLGFLELPLFYAQGFALLLFLLCPVIGFAFDTFPVTTTQGAYALHFWPFAVSVELVLAALSRGLPYETLWRARQMWVGLAPVYARACMLAVFGGRYRKPVYRVTRKVDVVAVYWRESLLQWGLLAALVLSFGYALATQSVLRSLDLGSAYWGAFLGLCLLGFLRRSYYRVDVRGVVLGWLRLSSLRARPAEVDLTDAAPASVRVDLTTRDRAGALR